MDWFVCIAVVFISLLRGVPAPVPRCSPFIIINKLMEWQSFSSDMNPVVPVPPCEYGGPFQALLAGDTNAVFVLDEPELVPRHNMYELVWFLKTGYARMMRMLRKKERFEFDFNILREGYNHHTEEIRTQNIGHGTLRRPELLYNETIFENVLGENLKEWWIHGEDQYASNFQNEGPLYLEEEAHLDPDQYHEYLELHEEYKQPPHHQSKKEHHQPQQEHHHPQHGNHQPQQEQHQPLQEHHQPLQEHHQPLQEHHQPQQEHYQPVHEDHFAEPQH